jgi:hypothetical protein
MAVVYQNLIGSMVKFLTVMVEILADRECLSARRRESFARFEESDAVTAHFALDESRGEPNCYHDRAGNVDRLHL